MNDNIEYSKLREQRRREWAALQNPELVTTQQALAMMYRKNSAGFSDFMKLHNVMPIRAPGFPGANFYTKSEVESLILKGVTTVRKKPGRPFGSINENTKRITFESMRDGSWTIEEFMQAWGSSDTSDQVRSLLERAPSVLKLSPQDAQQLMLIFSRLGGKHFRITSFKFDKKYFLMEISRQLPSRQEQKKLAQILDSLYESTDIGVFDPNILVKILYELMVSNPKNKPSTG